MPPSGALVDNDGRNSTYISQKSRESGGVCRSFNGIGVSDVSLKDGAFGKVSLQATRCGLSINQIEMKLMLSPTKTGVSKFQLPRIYGQSLGLFYNVKYLGVILDPKFS